MDIFVQQVMSGLATGGIYASLALALVMIYQATDVVNFAQGEMAMFATYIAWSMMHAGLPYWGAFLATLVIAFVGGVVIQRVIIRPVENKPILTIVIVTLGLLVICNSIAGWVWTYLQKPFPSPFPREPIRVGNVVFGAHDPKAGACGSLYNLCSDPRLHHEMSVTSGLRADEAASLVSEFFASKRNRGGAPEQ